MVRGGGRYVTSEAVTSMGAAGDENTKRLVENILACMRVGGE